MRVTFSGLFTDRSPSGRDQVMNGLPLQGPHQGGPYFQAWLVSAVLHTVFIGAAVMLLADLKAPDVTPFRWDVALVERPSRQEGQTSPALTEAAVPEPSTPSPPRESPPPRPAAPPRRAAPVRSVQEDVPVEQAPVQPPPPSVVDAPKEIPPEPIETAQERPLERQETEPLDPPTEAIPPVQEPAPSVAESPTTEPLHTAAESVTPSEVTPTTQTTPNFSEDRSSPPANPPPQEEPAAPAELTTPSAKQTAPAAVDSPTGTAPAPSPPQTAGTLQRPARGRGDLRWLAETLYSRVEQLKRYPYLARMNRWEGRVVLKAVILESGELADLQVAQSSGHAVLDRDAMEILRRATPLPLKQPLGQPRVAIHVPVSYTLR